ncbi:39S ribosomal protein L33, mitochondrial isoform X2 [Papio anubis]|uniref:39S ribosomal protein L33, mitochondrial isoform X2 n=1 Tax=Papio anubis TaxID=9555 RepID=UPI0012AD8845|nr:39S ribosomal protein L33, mitochondrial isoform X2 [Papio anubis]
MNCPSSNGRAVKEVLGLPSQCSSLHLAEFPLPRASQSKNILVRMVSQAGTGFCFNTKRNRLKEKLTLLHYDPVAGEKSKG